MTNETKSDIEINEKKIEQNNSNVRALIILSVFIALFIAMIAYEVVSKK